jgi:hypothetical protein
LDGSLGRFFGGPGFVGGISGHGFDLGRLEGFLSSLLRDRSLFFRFVLGLERLGSFLLGGFQGRLRPLALADGFVAGFGFGRSAFFERRLRLRQVFLELCDDGFRLCRGVALLLG